MYTVPAKVPIQAKQLIATFEKKGDAQSAATTNGGADSDGAVGRLNREVSVEELAQPGTARRLLAEFETLVVRHSTTAVATTTPVKSPVRLASDGDVILMPTHRADDVASTAEVSPLDGDTTAHNGVESAAVSVLTNGAHVDEVDAVAVRDHSLINGVHADDENTNAIVEELPADRKTVLVVCAVREKTPLDVALVEATTQRFVTARHVVLVSDVNQLAINHGQAADEERRKVDAADLLVLVYQPTLNCVPAALQAWIEAVFQLDRTTFANKKCLVLLTTHRRPDEFSSASVLGDLSSYLWPPQVAILRHVGYTVLAPQAVHGANEADISDVIGQWSARLDNIWDEPAAVSPQ